MEEGFLELRDNLEKGVDLQVGMFVKDIAGDFKARAKAETLKGLHFNQNSWHLLKVWKQK